MSKTALISERIAILERELGKSGNKLGLEADIGNGTVGGWTDNQIDKPTAAVEKFLRHYNISERWWKTLQGPIFNAALEGKPTREQIEATVPENPLRVPEEVYRNLVEANSVYRLVPKVILEGKYVMVLESEMGKTVEGFREALKSKDQLIKDLKEEIAMYRASRRTTPEKRK